MNFLPYNRFEFTSPMRPAEALAAMQAHTEPENWFRIGWGNKGTDRFEGEVRADGFHVRRIIGYRNSFLPVIDGKVHAQGSGSRVAITMRPFVFVMIFAALWLMIALSIGTAGAAGGETLLSIGISLAAAAFLYLMVMGGFWWEASKQEQTLRTIFKAQAAPSGTPLVS